MKKIKTDPKNYNFHNEENKKLIQQSLKELGAGRSIVIDADNTVIGGNGIFEQAEQLGIPIEIIETDGTKLIAVKRIDLKKDDKKRQKLAFADNQVARSSEIDFQKVSLDLTKEEMLEFGALELDIDNWDSNIDLDNVDEDDIIVDKKIVIKCSNEEYQDILDFIKNKLSETAFKVEIC